MISIGRRRQTQSEERKDLSWWITPELSKIPIFLFHSFLCPSFPFLLPFPPTSPSSLPAPLPKAYPSFPLPSFMLNEPDVVSKCLIKCKPSHNQKKEMEIYLHKSALTDLIWNLCNSALFWERSATLQLWTLKERRRDR